MGLKQSLIENNSIQLQAKANNWREAIKIGTDMLIASGAITPAYHEAIIASVEQLGPTSASLLILPCPMRAPKTAC